MSSAPKVKANCSLPLEIAQEMQRGIMSYRYKGILTRKCPFDLALYSDVLWEIKPGCVLEFGSNMGGSALWLADTLDALGLSRTKLYTIDIEYMHEFKDPRINFIQCDVSDIGAQISEDFMRSLPRPILLIEDSSHQYHHVRNVLEFFHKHSGPGDYVIVEDGIISVMNAEEQYAGGPLQALHAFLDEHPVSYQIDRARCDFYGRNVTWNIDGYIRRVG